MKLFLSKLLMVIIPVGLLLVTMEILNHKNDQSSIYFQKKYFQENYDQLDGLIFGSSFMWCGIQPQFLDGNVGSFAIPGSAPNVDFLILKYAREVSKPKFVLLDASKFYFANFKEQFFFSDMKLPRYFPTIRANDFEDFFLTQVPLSQHLPLRRPEQYNQWGFQPNTPEELNIFKALGYEDSLIAKDARINGFYTDVIKLIEVKHTKRNLKITRKAITKCLEDNIKVIFVSPPKYHLFNQFVNEQHLNERDAFMKEVVDNKNVFFLNFDTLYERRPKLFFDVIHLNHEGSLQFTEDLNDTLKSILN